MKIVKHEKTSNRVLRLIGNVSGSISTFFLLRCVRFEKKNYKYPAIIAGSLFKLFEKPQNKWGTYYELSKSK